MFLHGPWDSGRISRASETPKSLNCGREISSAELGYCSKFWAEWQVSGEGTRMG